MNAPEEYYARLDSDAAGFELDAEASWFDLWHTHVDWDGLGNRSAEDRRRHLSALLVIYQRVRDQAEALGTAHQAWALIHEDDSSEDAVYLHTPNPNGSEFPYTFSGVQWGLAAPALLAGLVNEAAFDFGRSEFEGEVLHWVRGR